MLLRIYRGHVDKRPDKYWMCLLRGSMPLEDGKHHEGHCIWLI